MQYKQVLRIGMEIFSSPDTPPPVLIAVAQLLMKHESFPKLGAYRKRSPEQALWRMASNARLGGAERWEALSQLLQMRVTTAADAWVRTPSGINRRPLPAMLGSVRAGHLEALKKLLNLQV